MTDFCLCGDCVGTLLILMVLFFVWCPCALSSRISEEEREEGREYPK